MPPQHGLYTAIVAGMAVPLLGGSRFQVTGPTAAFIVILAPILVQQGLAGLLIAGGMAGVLLIAMGLFRLGRLIQFIPHPVTTGFTAGIGTVIGVLQIKDLLGLSPARKPDHFLELVWSYLQARHTARGSELFIGLLTLAVLALLPRWTKRVPAPLVALPLAAFLAWALHLEVSTIGSRFVTVISGVEVHEAKRLGKPHLHHVPLDDVAEPHASVEAFRDDVHELLLDGDLDLVRGWRARNVGSSGSMTKGTAACGADSRTRPTASPG